MIRQTLRRSRYRVVASASQVELQTSRLDKPRASSTLASSAIEDAVWDQYHLPANFDWAFGRLLEHLGFRRELHAAMFVSSRLIGWCAHAIEQASSSEAIRPRARYRGAAG